MGDNFPFSLKDCTLIVGPILTLTHYAFLIAGPILTLTHGGVPFSIPLKDCTLIVGPILTLTHCALFLADFAGAYRKSIG